MTTEEELRNIAKSDLGEVLMKYLDEKIKEMADISKIKEYPELLGKQEAVKILKELFSFLERAREKQPDIKRTNYS